MRPLDALRAPAAARCCRCCHGRTAAAAGAGAAGARSTVAGRLMRARRSRGAALRDVRCGCCDAAARVRPCCAARTAPGHMPCAPRRATPAAQSPWSPWSPPPPSRTTPTCAAACAACAAAASTSPTASPARPCSARSARAAPPRQRFCASRCINICSPGLDGKQEACFYSVNRRAAARPRSSRRTCGSACAQQHSGRAVCAHRCHVALRGGPARAAIAAIAANAHRGNQAVRIAP
jgi:hypothetical protein